MTRTTMTIGTHTRDRLVDIGRKNETYDTIINKLLDHYHNFTINPTNKVKSKK